MSPDIILSKEQMKNILVTGAGGQLGSEIRVLAENAGHRFFFTDIADLDISDYSAVDNFVEKNRIDLIINCAAFTQVDRAEEEETLARKINSEAVKNLAVVCKNRQAVLIHISTDYVFDGSNNLPYKEDEAPAPLGVYGRTKLEGEQAVIDSGCDYLIFRTSWLYSSFGNNFLKTMRRLTAERDTLQVVFDQVGTPTYAADLAGLLLKVIESDRLKENQGVYHFSNEGVCSWFDFAVEIATEFGHSCDIRPCYSDEFPSTVKRPAFSVLDKTKVKRNFGVEIAHWRQSMKRCIAVIQSEEQG